MTKCWTNTGTGKIFVFIYMDACKISTTDRPTVFLDRTNIDTDP